MSNNGTAVVKLSSVQTRVLAEVRAAGGPVVYDGFARLAVERLEALGMVHRCGGELRIGRGVQPSQPGR